MEKEQIRNEVLDLTKSLRDFKIIKHPKLEYYIGIDKVKDSRDTHLYTYALVQRNDRTNTIVFCKQTRNKKDFDLEVYQLQKIFDATVIEEVNKYSEA